MVLFSLYREYFLGFSDQIFGSDRVRRVPAHLEERMSPAPDGEARHHAVKAVSSDDVRRPMSVYATIGKRVFDLGLAIMMLPMVAIILLVVMPIVVRDGGPFIYRHPRVGRGGKMFDCLKIRTMRTDSAKLLSDLLNSDPEAALEWAETQKLRNDPRITRIGRILRKTSIDELPQLWNVIRGDMSLIGPRPVTVEEIERYGDAREDYMCVRPGITGLWQIAPSRYEMTYDERVEVDVSYARSVTFWGDMRILRGTVAWAMNPNGI